MRAARKVFQLREAALSGMRIPRTLITRDPDRANQFIHELGVERTVYKIFSATRHIWRETRVLRDAELDLLDHLRLAPVIFQEYIPADVDLRITVVGSQAFPAAIHSHEGTYKADFRMEMNDSRIEPAELPKEIEQSLLALMERIRLFRALSFLIFRDVLSFLLFLPHPFFPSKYDKSARFLTPGSVCSQIR